MRFATLPTAFVFSLLTAASAFAGSVGDRRPAAPTKSVSATAVATSTAMSNVAELREFNALVVASGVKARLRRPNEVYTVFAPTNEAVRQVPGAVRERLFVATNPALAKLVRAHIVPGAVDFTKLADGAELRTLSGEVLRVAKRADGSILLNGVYRINGAGLATANGLVYSLDRMIAPTNQ